jgi:hypothetical protein
VSLVVDDAGDLRRGDTPAALEQRRRGVRRSKQTKLKAEHGFERADVVLIYALSLEFKRLRYDRRTDVIEC